MTSFSIVITDKLGIHARPAALIVKEAGLFKDTKITFAKGEKAVDGKRLFAVMGLGVKCGEELKVTTEGPSEEEAAAKIKHLIEDNLCN